MMFLEQFFEEIANMLGLPSISRESALLSSNKLMMKKKFIEHDVTLISLK